MRQSFHEQLTHLQDQVVRMGSLVIAMLDQAVTALKSRDEALARTVLAADDEVDQMLIDLEVQSLQLFALQQPLARDLRVIGTSLKLVTDLERMADHATDIADIAIQLAGMPPLPIVERLLAMAELVRRMTVDAIQAYKKLDQAAARAMIQQDHAIDRAYKLLFEDLLSLMHQDASAVRQVTLLLQAAMYLERIGDHATNLGEWTIYLLTGRLEELNQ